MGAQPWAVLTLSRNWSLRGGPRLSSVLWGHRPRPPLLSHNWLTQLRTEGCPPLLPGLLGTSRAKLQLHGSSAPSCSPFHRISRSHPTLAASPRKPISHWPSDPQGEDGIELGSLSPQGGPSHSCRVLSGLPCGGLVHCSIPRLRSCRLRRTSVLTIQEW